MKSPNVPNMVFGPAGLTASGGNTNYQTSNAIDYHIDGRAYNQSTISATAAPTTDANTGLAFTALQADQACRFVWCINGSGTVVVAQGPIVDIDGDTDDYVDDGGRPDYPPVPDGYTAFADQVVQTAGNSSAWTFGASNWNATGITDVIIDVTVLPARPRGDARS